MMSHIQSSYRLKLVFMHAAYLLILILLFCKAGSAQSISNIVVSNDGSKMAFLRNGDSLFIKTIANTQLRSLFIDLGLKENGNQRFLVWSDDSNTLIYEKNSNLHLYVIGNSTPTVIKHNLVDSLYLFRWYMIRQVSFSNDHLYFSAANKHKKNQAFQLFDLNLKTGICTQLSEATQNAGNMVVSPDGRFIAMAFYNYVKNEPLSELHIINLHTKQKVYESSAINNVFVSSLRWSSNGSLLLMQENSKDSKLFEFNKENGILKERRKFDGAETVALDFLTDTSFLFVNRGAEKSILGSIDLLTNEKKIILNHNATFIQLAKSKSSTIIYSITESRIQNKKLYKIELQHNGKSKMTEVEALTTGDPLTNYNYKNVRYKNGIGEESSSFVYFSKNTDIENREVGLIIIPYGGYSDTYPDMSYFLHSKLFDYIDKGFILAFPNTRGINSEKQTTGYGKIQLEDTELFLAKIKSSFKVNPTKVFLLGHSHGATMVYYYLTHSKLFSGGVAINGASDWIKQADQKSMAGIPFGMGGVPAERVSEYKDASPLANINSLNAPVLSVAGKKDTQIPTEFNSLAFHEEAIRLGKKSKLLVFDNEGHLLLLDESKEAFWKEFDQFIRDIK